MIIQCLDGNNKMVHEIIVSSLLKNPELIGELLVDLNGNYVVQKALPVSKGNFYIEIMTKISENFHLLQNVSFGAKLSSKLLSTYPELKSIRQQNNIKNTKPIAIKGKPVNKQDRFNHQVQSAWNNHPQNIENNQKFSSNQNNKTSNFK